MVYFKEDTIIYSEIDETIAINYLVPNNLNVIQIIDGAQLIAEYNISTDTITPSQNSSSHITVTGASFNTQQVSIELEIDTEGTYNVTIGDPSINTITYTILLSNVDWLVSSSSALQMPMR